jgi:glycosyltransferase involved in cell wall biosynthesis
LKNKKNIVIITGSYPPNFCGVGDYTEKLIRSLLLTNKFQFELFHKSNWGVKYFLSYFRELINKKHKIYHIQYPTEGFGYSIVPLVLTISLRLIGKIVIITIHELSSRNILAYIYTQLLIFFSTKIIVTNSLELKHACRFIFNKKKIFLIPIASNINQSSFSNAPFNKRTIDLAYFGHIRPIKGIENFINTVCILKENLNIQLIGQVLYKYQDFYEKISSDAKKLNIDIITDKDENEVADLLSNVKIIYLPFPDGISSRRGTLLGSMENGCVVISKKSAINEFNDFFNDYVYLVESDEEAVNVIKKLLNNELMPKDLTQVKNMFSWENVISEHLKVYSS